MRIRRFLALVLVAATVWMNVASAGNIVHGVSVVVIDPGHGGKFPGAYYAGVYEKNLTLAVGLKLGKLIEERMPGVKVVYTRKSDKALGETLAEDLQKRADIANTAGGDLFISIHVNAARSTSARGVETLIMGESSKEQQYNQNALFENNREDLIDMSDERTAAIVRAYIQNLQFTYGEFSMAMARCMQSNYQNIGCHSRGIKPQLLRVLYATDMPGVLTEIGFLSHPQERAYLRSEKGQDEIALALYRSVKEYSDNLRSVRGEEAAPERPVAEEDKSAPITEAAEPSAAKPVENTVAVAQPAEKPVAKSAEKTSGSTVVKPAEKTAEKYTIQVMASPKVVPLSSPSFKSYRNKVKQYTSDGKFRYKYCVGEYASSEQAQPKLREVRKIFPEAYVVRCRGTQIVK